MKLFLFVIFTLVLVGCNNTVEVTSSMGKLSTASTVNFGFITTDANSVKLIELANTGGTNLTDVDYEILDGAQYTFTGDSFPGINGTCDREIQSGQKCYLEVRFQNATPGLWEDYLKVSYYNTVDRQTDTIRLTGRSGVIANLISDEASFIIDAHEPGPFKILTIKVTNQGDLSAADLSVSFEKQEQFDFYGGSYPGVGGTCGLVVSGSKSCSVVVQFQSSVNGTFSDSLSFSYHNGAAPRSLNIPISAVAASIEAVVLQVADPNSEPEKRVKGETFTKKVKFKNTGYLPGNIQSIAISDMTDVAFTQNCSSPVANLAVGAVCEVEMTFTPSVTGDFVRQVALTYHSGKSVKSVVGELKFFIQQPADLVFYVGIPLAVHDFGGVGVGDSVKKNILIRNEGEVVASAAGFFTGITAPFSISSTTCLNPLTIYPGFTCSVEIEYTPTSAVASNNLMSLTYQDGVSSVTKSFSVMGVGHLTGKLTVTSPVVAFINFGEHRSGFPSAVQQIEFENTGMASLTINSIGFNDTYFGYEGGTFPGTSGSCTLTLIAGQVCRLAMVSTGMASGNLSSPLSISYHNGLEEIITAYLSLKSMVMEQALIVVKNPIGNEKSVNTDVPNFDQESGSMPSPPYVESAGFYPRGVASTVSISLQNKGTKALAFNSLNVSYISGGTNPFTTIDTSNCASGIPPKGTCEVDVVFNPSTAGDFQLLIDSNYYNGYENANLDNHTFTFKSADLANVAMSVSAIDWNIVKGTSVNQIITLTNTGTGAASNLSISKTDLPNSHFGLTTTCGSSLAAGANCQATLTFNPSVASSWLGSINMSYDNGGIMLNPLFPADINFQLKEKLIYVDAVSVSEAKLAASGSITAYDFGDKEVLTTNSRSIILTNSGGKDAIVSTCTGLSAPMTSNCFATIPAGTSSTLTLNFSPLAANITNTYSQDLTITYNSGFTTRTLVITVMGKAVAPKSTHKGWRSIYANGPKTLNGSSSVRFKWNTMTVPYSIAISKYVIYRRIGDSNFNLSTDTAIATITNLADLSYTDTSVSEGTLYYYYVVPYIYTIHAAEPLPTIHNYLRVMVPPKYMTLIHRMTANQVMCEEVLSKSISFAYWNRCVHSGPGSVNGFFDINHDLVVDMYETNTASNNEPGNLPKANFNQQSAWNHCVSKTTTFNGIAQPLSKRLLTRKEFTIASKWDSSLSLSDIDGREGGTSANSFCNDNGALENSGNNTNCISQFGLMDAVGNAWEWVADRLYNGLTVDSGSRLVNIDDYANVNFSSLTQTNQEVYGFKCLSQALKMPLPTNGVGDCDTSLLDITTVPVANFHNDYFTKPMGGAMGLLVGGSHSDEANSDAGTYTSAWLSPNAQGAARCAHQVNY